MRTDFSGSLIRMIFASGLTPDITGQLSLAVLMGSLIKMICGAGHNKLDRI